MAKEVPRPRPMMHQAVKRPPKRLLWLHSTSCHNTKGTWLPKWKFFAQNWVQCSLHPAIVGLRLAVKRYLKNPTAKLSRWDQRIWENDLWLNFVAKTAWTTGEWHENGFTCSATKCSTPIMASSNIRGEIISFFGDVHLTKNFQKILFIGLLRCFYM